MSNPIDFASIRQELAGKDTRMWYICSAFLMIALALCLLGDHFHDAAVTAWICIPLAGAAFTGASHVAHIMSMGAFMMAHGDMYERYNRGVIRNLVSGLSQTLLVIVIGFPLWISGYGSLEDLMKINSSWAQMLRCGYWLDLFGVLLWIIVSLFGTRRASKEY